MACYEYKGVKYTEEDLVKLLQSQQLKTRRILELQSDLFQKGRDRKLLSKEEFILSNGKKVYPKYSGKIDMFNPSSVNNEKLVLEYEGKEYTNFSFVEDKQDIDKFINDIYILFKKEYPTFIIEKFRIERKDKSKPYMTRDNIVFVQKGGRR